MGDLSGSSLISYATSIVALAFYYKIGNGSHRLRHCERLFLWNLLPLYDFSAIADARTPRIIVLAKYEGLFLKVG